MLSSGFGFHHAPLVHICAVAVSVGVVVAAADLAFPAVCIDAVLMRKCSGDTRPTLLEVRNDEPVARQNSANIF
jgi:hypothetical protein